MEVLHRAPNHKAYDILFQTPSHHTQCLSGPGQTGLLKQSHSGLRPLAHPKGHSWQASWGHNRTGPMGWTFPPEWSWSIPPHWSGHSLPGQPRPDCTTQGAERKNALEYFVLELLFWGCYRGGPCLITLNVFANQLLSNLPYCGLNKAMIQSLSSLNNRKFYHYPVLNILELPEISSVLQKKNTKKNKN